MARADPHPWQFKAPFDEVRERIRQIVGADKTGGFVSRVLARELRP
jgi:hypothetical protein